MVLKVKKGGVRSGNTLRGLHSLRTRRYSRHACLIGRSNLPPKAMTSLVQSTSDYTWVTDTLGSTNVLLSLNKKQRWRLPDTFSHMIQTGCFNPKTTVSFLERHKLRRCLNCVRFLSNKGKVKDIKPRNKAYFSFNLNKIDRESSKRQLRREKAKVATQMKMKDEFGFNSKMRTATVFTLSGQNRDILSNTPEYRMEVFYPCPKSCSLTFNPKYTNFASKGGEDGIQEVNTDFVTSEKKLKSRHRKNFTKAKWGDLEYEEIDDDVNQMWNEVYQDNSVDSETNEDVELDEKIGTRSFYLDEDVFSSEKADSGSFLTDLISRAEQTRTQCSRKLIVQPDKGLIPTNVAHGKPLDKSHIVVDEGSNTWMVREKPASPKEDRVQYTNLDFARVTLPSEETSVEHLRSKYGQLYSDADSEPRRFVINISDDIKRILNPIPMKNTNSTYLSYLVFVHDDIYDSKWDTFRVCLNSYICKNTKRICHPLDLKQCSIDDLMNLLFGILLDMKEGGELILGSQNVLAQHCIATTDIVNRLMLSSVEAFRPSDEIARIAFSDRLQDLGDSPTKLHRLASSMDEYHFCEICYDNVNHIQLNATYGTKLSQCGHMFCDHCWRNHVRTRSRDGAIRIACPGYDCDTTVGPVTLLSLIHIMELGQLLQRSCEDQVETSANSKWCPIPECGRVIRLDVHKMAPNLSRDVTCACNARICFSCLKPAHWPAKCDQAEDYTVKLSRLKPQHDEHDTPIIPILPKHEKAQAIIIEGCKCPSCNRFIEKNGGCPYMACRCGHAFCWKCLQPFSHHNHPNGICVPNRAHLRNKQLRLVVHHIGNNPSSEMLHTQEGNTLTKTRTSPKQRASMYQRALHQRQENDKKNVARASDLLACKISSKASKDLNFKREVLSHCGVDEIPSNEPSLAAVPTQPHVTKLLRSCQEIKDALHHVTEFTFVLLQHVPHSVEKQRVLRLANDLSGWCSLFRSILEAGDQQDANTAVKRLMNIQLWAKRDLDTLLNSVEKFRC